MRGLHADGRPLNLYKETEEQENDEKIREAIRAMKKEQLAPSRWTRAEIAKRAGVGVNTVRRRPWAVKEVLKRNPGEQARAEKKGGKREAVDSSMLEAALAENQQLKARVKQLEDEMTLMNIGTDSLHAHIAVLKRDNEELREKLRRLGNNGEGGKVILLN